MSRSGFTAVALNLLALGVRAGCPDDPAACPDLKGCWQAPTVLEDVATGWPNSCLGLVASNASDMSVCEETCKGDPSCTVWQYSGTGEAADPGGHCFSGTPIEGCRSNRTGYKVNGGQRLQHGNVKVIKNAFPGIEVMNLMEYKMSDANVQMDAARCKDACYSDTSCGVWQYAMGGCWREHVSAAANYTALGTQTDSPFAKDVQAGEYILHYCPEKPPPKESNNLPYIIAGIVLGLLLVCCIVYLLMKPKKKPKKTRAVKIEKAEEPVVPLFVPQPTVMVQQPSVVYSAPVQTQSVVYTQVAQPTYTVQQPVETVVQQPTVVQAAPMQSVSYMQPTMVTEAVEVQQPLLGAPVVIS